MAPARTIIGHVVQTATISRSSPALPLPAAAARPVPGRPRPRHL